MGAIILIVFTSDYLSERREETNMSTALSVHLINVLTDDGCNKLRRSSLSKSIDPLKPS